MITQTRLLLISLLGLAAVLTFLKVPLASSQGVTIVAAEISGTLPLADLDSALWQQTTAVAVPLSAQTTAKPLLAQANIKAVNARALYNDTQIAFLLEWDDDTLDDSTVRVQDFSDAVALQFPLVQGQPFFCMGQQDGNVNIWHWKADWQANIIARQDVDTVYPHMYVDEYTFADTEAGAASSVADYQDVNYLPAMAAGNLFARAAYDSPVEDLIAGSFGSLTSQPADMQNVQGHGQWADGKWRVVFVRDLVSLDADDVHFNSGQIYSLAFAAWDGANNERNGQKSTSQWVALHLGAESGGVNEGETAVSEDETAAPRTTASGAQTSSVNTMEGVPYIFVPMLLVVLLVLAAGAAVFLLTKLPDKK